MSLIDTDVDLAVIPTWTQVADMTNVIHTEEVDVLSVAGGHLQIEPFCVPNLDCRIIGALIYHCCSTGAIDTFSTERICHTFQDGCDTIVKLDCWDLRAPLMVAEPVWKWTEDPCKRLDELRCCRMEWLKAGKKKDWSFRDSSGSTAYLSEACLKEMIQEAELQCEAQNCVNSRCITFGCDYDRC